jgi:hypothetical protein
MIANEVHLTLSVIQGLGPDFLWTERTRQAYSLGH